MKTKIENEWIDYRFGFPVHLQNVPMVKVRDVWTPKINYAKLKEALLIAVANKPANLTGNEIRFIRLSFEKTLAEFSQLFYVSHAAVIKWESFGDNPTRMNWSTEKDIRLFVISHHNKGQLTELYERLRTKAKPGHTEAKVDLQTQEAVFA